MDNLRGAFDTSDVTGDDHDWDAHEDEQGANDLPPEAIGQDERRMQVRAYNHWAALLGDRTFPSIEELEPHNLDDFGPFSVLLDFSHGIDDPAVQFLGDELARECGAEGEINKLSDVPPRSLLSRITDHYMQILANEAPIGFEAEFVNQRGSSIMYRGILLPYSSNDETIDFIYGVINWKEIADQVTSDELLLEIDQALEADEEGAEDEPHKHHTDPVTEWADSPLSEEGEDASEPANDTDEADIFELSTESAIAEHEIEASDTETSDEADRQDAAEKIASLSGILGDPPEDADIPMPDFGHYGLDDPEDEDEEDVDGAYSFASLADYIEAPAKKALDLDAEPLDPAAYSVEDDEPSEEFADEAETAPVDIPEAMQEPIVADASAEAGSSEDEQEVSDDAPVGVEPVPALVGGDDIAGEGADLAEETGPLPDDAGLYDFLASARELAETARASEDRSREALYAAVGRAYDFSLAAKDAPADYDELIAESGLTAQERAPMVPVVKLVFGANYDKTRVTEYATVLAHAHRLELESGSLARFLAATDGGLKGVVKAERRLRREESGQEVEPETEIRKALAKKLRELEALTLEALDAEGPEFSLVVVRRDGEGGIGVIGEIDEDIPLIERAARKLVG